MEPKKPNTPRHGAVFALGFRPFFLLAGFAAVALMALWAWRFAAGLPFNAYYGFVLWHGHEMVFGFSSAVIAGFLLTAVKNWTGVQTLRGTPLAVLAGLWLAGRLLPFAPVAPWWVAAVDGSFLPILSVAVGWPLWRGRHYKSFLFVGIVCLLALANLVLHGARLGLLPGAELPALYFGFALIVLLIVVMGGRVIPFFTEKAVAGSRPRRWSMVEVLAPLSVAMWALGLALSLTGSLLAGMALAAGVFNGIRLIGWYHGGIWRLPILWVLHSAYGWLVVGFIGYGLSLLGFGGSLASLHALSVGGIGLVTLGMMARVSLGHTGRPLDLPAGLTTAFVLLNAASALRVFAVQWWPDWYAGWIATSGGLWALAFTLFVWRYLPILWRVRVDGRDG